MTVERAHTFACPCCRAVYRTGAGYCARDGERLQPVTRDPNLGTVFGGYRVQSILGDGAMGRVYRVEALDSGRRYAMKTLFGDAATPSMRARFRLEAQVMRAIRHRNLISAIDLLELGGGREPGHLYLVMEYAPSGSLEDLVCDTGTVSALTGLALIKGVLRGLGELHRRGVVHRDIKPANILLHELPNGELVPRLTDFGVARVKGLPASNGALTLEGTVVGSPSFMPPEQAMGTEIDARCDIYAVGVTLQAILTSKLPFSGSPQEILLAKATQAPLLGDVAGLDEPVRRLIRSFTATAPAGRPTTAEEALQMVQEAEQKLRKGPMHSPAMPWVAAAAAMCGAAAGAAPVADWCLGLMTRFG